MSFFAVLFALVLEQARPLARVNWIYTGLLAWARWAYRSLDAGKPHHGWITWVFAVIVPTLATLLVHWLLWQVNVLLSFAWNVVVLYLTLGFRQFSHYFTDIRDALDDGNEEVARGLLAEWRHMDASELPRSEIVRHVIEHSVLAAHRHVFGVLGWFSVLAALGFGPAGAVLYRMSEFVARYWSYKGRVPGEGASPALQGTANSAWGVIDFVPSRITSVGFAVVGSFEDAIDAWRSYNQRLLTGRAVDIARRNEGLILAATSGAVNVRLGSELLKPVRVPALAQEYDTGRVMDVEPAAGLGSIPGREAEVGHLRSVVGLVWRSVVLWMVLLALLTLARLLG